MIEGSGQLISDKDERGRYLPFMTTNEILKQIEKFGFIVKYDVKRNLPGEVIAFLSKLYTLGYDKITRIIVQTKDNEGKLYDRPTVIVMKTSEYNDDLLTFGCKVSQNRFNRKLDSNTVINVTEEPGMTWSWLKYMANISDLLDENLDHPKDFELDTGLQTGVVGEHVISKKYTIYGQSNCGDEDENI